MEIIYIDPGYGKGVTDGGQTLTCVESDNYNPINGVAYTFSVPQTDSPMHFLPIPTSALAVPTVSDGQFFTKIISFKCSVYLDLAYPYDFFAGFQKNLSDTVDFDYVMIGSRGCTVKGKISSQSYSKKITSGAVKGLHDIVISISLVKYQYGNSAAFYITLTFDIDGDIYSPRTGVTSLESAPFGNGIFVSPAALTGGTCYVSNIIVASSTEISDTSPEVTSPAPILSSDTTLIKLPLSTPPSGNFSAEGDGKYVGTASGQQLLQTIDATDLITKFGGDTKVNNLIVYGNPGYRTGNGITTAYGGYVDGSFYTSGSCTLSADPNAIASVAWDETTNNRTLDDLDGLQVGWKI